MINYGAAAWLVSTRSVYQHEGITVDENWLGKLCNCQDCTIETEDVDNETASNSAEDKWSEDEADTPAEVTDRRVFV